MGGPSLLCLLLSFKEAERKIMIPESSLYDSWQILSSSTTIMSGHLPSQLPSSCSLSKLARLVLLLSAWSPTQTVLMHWYGGHWFNWLFRRFRWNMHWKMPRRPLNFLGLHLPLLTSRYIYLKSKLVHANCAVLIVSVFKTSVFQKPPDVLLYTKQDHHHPHIGPVDLV